MHLIEANLRKRRNSDNDNVDKDGTVLMTVLIGFFFLLLYKFCYIFCYCLLEIGQICCLSSLLAYSPFLAFFLYV